MKGDSAMKTLKATTIILLVIYSSGLTTTDADAQDKSNLEVLEIKPEPVRRGRNIVRAKIRNTSSEDQAFDLDVRTESTGNWQTQFHHVIAGGETKWIRQAYKIDVIVGQYTREAFYNPGHFDFGYAFVSRRKQFLIVHV